MSYGEFLFYFNLSLKKREEENKEGKKNSVDFKKSKLFFTFFFLIKSKVLNESCLVENFIKYILRNENENMCIYYLCKSYTRVHVRQISHQVDLVHQAASWWAFAKPSPLKVYGT